jgi:hypothetical protein
VVSAQRRTPRSVHDAASESGRILEPARDGSGASRDNFLDIKISNEVMYRFDPPDPALAQAAQQCADFYGRDRIAMMNLVTMTP